MRLLTDHCVPQALVDALRTAGHSVTRVVDATDPSAPDRDVAGLAARLSAVLVTTDDDFSRRADFAPRRYAGIVVVKDYQKEPARLERRLARLLRGRREHDFVGAVFVLDRRSVRVRR